MNRPSPDIAQVNADLAHLVAQKLGVSSAGLDKARRRAGRLLPRWVRRDLRWLAAQETMAGHPKLRMQIDTARVSKVARRVARHLEAIDPKERAKDRWLGLAAVVAFNFLLVAALVIAVLAWRGVIGPG